MVRNTLKYVANKDMKAFAKDLKTIYTASDEPAALKQLDAVTDKWAPMYPSAMNRWHDNWDAISPIFKFSKEVRTAFYTTYSDKKTMPIFHETPVNKGLSEKISA